MDDLEVLHRSLGDAPMEVEYVGLCVIIPDWRLVLQLNDGLRVLVLPACQQCLVLLVVGKSGQPCLSQTQALASQPPKEGSYPGMRSPKLPEFLKLYPLHIHLGGILPLEAHSEAGVWGSVRDSHCGDGYRLSHEPCSCLGQSHSSSEAP